MNSGRMICMAATAMANCIPRSVNASGMAVDMTRPRPINTTISTRTGSRSGSIQLVAHVV